MIKRPLVSIVTPVYNAEKFLKDTIKTVQDQTYANWELIFVDDTSTDNSVEIIQAAQKSDKRIKLKQRKQNSGGAAQPRNDGTKLAKGRYLAFLDADDLWDSKKLEKQVKFMQENDYVFTFTSYEFTDSHGRPTDKRTIVPGTVIYSDALKYSSIFTSTTMFDMSCINKDHILMPNYLVGEDLATWWGLLKKYDYAYGMAQVLSYYRRPEKSLSSNKIIAAKWRWRLYREHEKLSLIRSLRYFIYYVRYAVGRRI